MFHARRAVGDLPARCGTDSGLGHTLRIGLTATGAHGHRQQFTGTFGGKHHQHRGPVDIEGLRTEDRCGGGESEACQAGRTASGIIELPERGRTAHQGGYLISGEGNAV